jgi:hypothetical protein
MKPVKTPSNREAYLAKLMKYLGISIKKFSTLLSSDKLNFFDTRCRVLGSALKCFKKTDHLGFSTNNISSQNKTQKI